MWRTIAAVGGAILSGLGSRRQAEKAKEARRQAAGYIESSYANSIKMLDKYYENSQQFGQSYMNAARDLLGQQMGFLGGIYGNSQASIREFQKLADEFAAVGKDRFDRYVEMFDPLEEKLHDYYMNLNPDELAARGNQTAQEQYQLAMSQVNEDLAARGLLDSGIQGQLNHELAMNMAETKAENILNAPHQVAELQSGWLDYGKTAQDSAWNMYAQGLNAQSAYTQMKLNADAAYMQSGMMGYGNYASMLGGAYNYMGNSLNSYYDNYLNAMGNYSASMASLYGGEALSYAQNAASLGGTAGRLLGSAIGGGLFGGTGSLFGGTGGGMSLPDFSQMENLPSLGY